MSDSVNSPSDERALFETLVDLPPAERDAALVERCNGDTALRSRLGKLLAAHDHTRNFVRTPPPVRRLAEAEVADTAMHGRTVGRYRIIDTIAAGGMGVVYRAHRDDSQTIVALKLIRPGLARGNLLKRFEHEALVLGQLDHPGIARILEAGAFDLGFGPQPYFAMEFIEGERLSVFNAASHPSLPDRLELIAKVCDAVQHAHSKGVIHRDLKPDNILVMEKVSGVSGQVSGKAGSHTHPDTCHLTPDTSPTPKIVDFGVARVTDADLAVTTMQTGIGQLIGTLPYMSPEQVAGDVMRIDTRSDVYALGVILYELLGGRLPHQIGAHSVVEAARIIMHEEPTRLSSIDRMLKGDLDTIVAKAMEKDPARRYQSAGELAADLRRHLHDEPILARPATTMYQLRRFARRNRALVLGAAAVMLMLALGIAGTSIGLVRANLSAQEARDQEQSARQAAEEAQKQREGAELVSAFLQQMLATTDPQVTRSRDVSVKTMLDEAVAQLDGGALRGQSEVEARVRSTVADSYQSLGYYAPAQSQYEIALSRTLDARGERHPDAAQAMINLARILGRNQEFPRGLALTDQAIGILGDIHGRDDLLTIDAERARAHLVTLTGNAPDAKRLFEDLLPRAIRVSGTDQTELIAELKVGLAYTCNDLPRGEKLVMQAIETYRQVLGTDHDKIARALTNLGYFQFYQGKRSEGLATLEQAIAMRERLFGPDHPSIAISLYNMGNCRHLMREYEQAVSSYQAALKIQTERLVPDHWDTCRTQFRLGRTLNTLKRYEEAEGHLRASIAMVSTASARDAFRAEVMRHLAGSLAHLRRFDEANATLMEALEIAGRPDVNAGKTVTLIVKDLATLFDKWSKPQEASRWREQFEQRRAAEEAAAGTASRDDGPIEPTAAP